MKALPVVLMILSAAAYTAVAESSVTLDKSIEARLQTRQNLRQQREEADAAIVRFLGELPAPVATPDTSMPTREGTDTVAVSDGGMLFDANNSMLMYINNVRVADPRIELRCRERLLLRLPGKTLEAGKASAKSAAAEGLNTPSRTQNKATAITPAVTDITPSRTQEPLRINAAAAIVNATDNIIYLEGDNASGAPLTLTHETDSLTLTGPETESAGILADTNGDILITAATIDMKWTDRHGTPCTLHNENGTGYYHAEQQRLYFTGPTSLRTAEGNIHCEELMAIDLMAEKDAKDETGFMSQFRGLRIKGVRGAEATGNVCLSRPSTHERPAAEIRGTRLTYNGLTGETSISGQETTLTYGQQILRTDDRIHIASNGDITLSGKDISGNYNRSIPGKDKAPLQGTFSTSGTILYTAATHTIVLPNGLTAKDALSDIRADGKVELLLLPDATAKVPAREKTGMVNLAIAGYKDIAQVKATGGIVLHYKSDTEDKGLTLTADAALLNFLTAEATLTADAGNRTDLQYDDFRLAANSADRTSTLYLAPNGDITLTGDNVNAALPGKKQQTTVSCTDTLRLMRADARLVLGPGSRMVSENGILTSNAELYLTLAPGPAEKNKPLMPRYPHLVFNYDGLKLADTTSGGTIQTDRASMQCTGPIHVEMLPGDEKNELAGIHKATAAGQVAIAGKDTSGRLMRATGDLLTIDGQSGVKTLTGKRVTLQDAYNTHIASGKGACVVLDKKNNTRISGEKQSTAATRIHEQVEKNKKSN